MDSIIGITAKSWFKVLSDNRFKIRPKQIPKAGLITFLSIKNSIQTSKEYKLFGERINSTKIEYPPIFIIGHWRSGTTFLHNLISTDNQFAYPNLFEVRHPNTFLQKEELFKKRLEIYKAQKRMMDNIHVALDDPAEEEFAIAIMSLKSPLIGWMFPSHSEFYERYSTFKNVDEDEIQSWKNEFLFYLKKLTLKYNKQLLLKSPVNTGRIRLLLEMFPDAKYIHIHRNPYDVFRSTKKLYATAVEAAKFQNVISNSDNIDDFIVKRYAEMYDNYFKDLPLIPSKNYYELEFEKLESEAKLSVKKIYESLKISGFEKMAPNLEEYLKAHSNYKKNNYTPLDDSVKQKIDENWKFCFDKWGYDS